MIKIIDNINEYDASDFENDVFFQRIKAEYNANLTFKDALFYVSFNGTSVDAYISKVGSSVTLSALNGAPFDEINEFLKVIGFSVILCDERYSDFFQGSKTYGYVLGTEGKVFENCEAELLDSENLKDAYGLIKEVFDITDDYMLWLADISHRIRHNVAKFVGIYNNNALVSCGFSLFETLNSAVISSVLTVEIFRSKGLGSNIVKRLLSENTGIITYAGSKRISSILISKEIACP